MTVRFPIYGSNFKGAVWIPPPQQPELIAPNKPSGRGLSKGEPDANQRFAWHSRFGWHSCLPGAHVRPVPTFHPSPMRTWRPYLTGTPFRLAPMPTRYPCSPGAPFRLAPTPTRCPCLPASLVSPGAHTHSSLMHDPMSMLAWRPCLPGAHVCPALMFA